MPAAIDAAGGRSLVRHDPMRDDHGQRCQAKMGADRAFGSQTGPNKAVDCAP